MKTENGIPMSTVRRSLHRAGVFGLLISMGWAGAAQAQYEYTIQNGQVTITRYQGGPGGNLIIPSTIEGRPVTAIGYRAFANAIYGAPTHLTIPDSVRTIGEKAFEVCSALSSVRIGNGVRTIGEQTFWSCESLTSVTFGRRVAVIDQNAFGHCTRLERVTLPDSVTRIWFNTFFNCASLQAINVGRGNRVYSSVGGVVFSKDKKTLMHFPPGKAGSYTISDRVTRIAENAFIWCNSLTRVIIGNGVTDIDYWAFDHCSSLASITVGERIARIGDSAFQDCRQLTKVYFLGDAPAVEDGVFAGSPVTVYYASGTRGWGSSFAGRPARRFYPPRLVVRPTGRSIGSGTGTTRLTVSNGGRGRLIYRASERTSWLRILSGARGTNNGTIRLAYTANSSTRGRTGIVTLSATGARGSPRRVRIVQAGNSRVNLAISNLRVRRPGNIRLRRFNSCRFHIVNRGGELYSESVGVHFYLSRDRTFGNADDRKIGDTKFVGLSIPAGATKSITMGLRRRRSMVRLWSPTLAPRGYYYLFARISPISVRETRWSDNVTQTGSRFAYSSTARSAKVAGSETVESWPAVWARSGAGEWVAAPELVDDDQETVWTGEPGAGPWAVAIDFSETVGLRDLELQVEHDWRTAVEVLATEELTRWFDLQSVTNWPVDCRAVFFDFRGDGTGEPPAIREIRWEEE